MSSEEAKQAIEDWVSKRAHEITLKAQEDMDEIAQCAKINLSAEIDGLKAQADVMDVLAPLNLINLITEGGFVKAEVFTVSFDRSNLTVTVADKQLFYERGTRITLAKGRYKVVLIVEKLEDETV